MSNRVVGLFTAFVCAVALVSCGGGSDSLSSPPGPSPSTSTVTGVIVTSFSSVANPGESSQFSATATFSNGTNQDVTRQASWTSTNPSVATVLTGMVTAVGAGEADILATYQRVTGSTRMTVPAQPAPRFTLAGRITQFNGPALWDVLVELKGRGRTTRSDANGGYAFSGLGSGQYTLSATKSGFLTTEPQTSVSGDTTLDFTMFLTGRIAASPEYAIAVWGALIDTRSRDHHLGLKSRLSDRLRFR